MLVDVRGSILSDAGSTPAISTTHTGALFSAPFSLIDLANQSLEVSPLREIQRDGMVRSLS